MLISAKYLWEMIALR